MTPLELLEATKVEVDKRWDHGNNLFYDEGAACLLGCVGFALWGEEFAGDPEENWYERQEAAYDALRREHVVREALAALASHSFWPEGRDNLEKVYRHNDSRLHCKADANDFIDLAITDLKTP